MHKLIASAALLTFIAIAGLAHATLKEHEAVPELQLRAHVAESWSKSQDEQINAQGKDIEDLQAKVRSLQLDGDLWGKSLP
jgi:hypothetical protein